MGGPWAKHKKERNVPATNVPQAMSVREASSTSKKNIDSSTSEPEQHARNFLRRNDHSAASVARASTVG
jgi:hypothetical protein